MPSSPTAVPRCPCGTGLAYADCCGRCHAGTSTAPTAAQLMRSRYSAFALGRPDYLLDTWHPDTRPDRLDLDPAVRWTSLEILGTSGGTLFEVQGSVEFRAAYRTDGRGGAQHEVSRFVREHGRWWYLDGLSYP